MKKVENLIKDHLEARPAAQAKDVYKLLYQGVFGVGHIVSERAWDILVEEANRIDLTSHSGDPLLEPVSPDGSMVRINLRQYLNTGGDLKELYEVMRESGEHRGDPELFLEYWRIYGEMVGEDTVEGSREEVEELDSSIEEEGVRPMHHSEAYLDAYYPAYRVVLRRLYRKKIGLLG